MINAPLFDLHVDTILKLEEDGNSLSQDNKKLHVDIPKMRRGNVNGEVFAIWVDSDFLDGKSAFNEANRLLEIQRNEIEKNPFDMKLITKAVHLTEAQRENKISAILGLEGGIMINNSINNLEKFYNEGARLMTLTHIKSLDWAGSTNDLDRKFGLTSFGKDVVQAMNDLGMIIDVAHVGEKTVIDAVKISKKPIICSHTAALGVVDAKDRLCSDEMIHAIASTGGVIGIIMFPVVFKGANPSDFSRITKKFQAAIAGKLNNGMSPKEKFSIAKQIYQSVELDFDPPGLEGVLPHFDYMIDLVEENHIAIGTDFDGISVVPKGFEDISKADNLRELMKNHGYSDERIRKIFGENARRVMEKII